jgi:Holliday junction resolvasome RuvABC endonuclease subunit
MRGAGTELLIGMTTHLQSWCETHHIPYTAVHTGTLKKATVGCGNAKKPEMMAWFEKQTGRKPIDDNEADAFALLCFAMKELGIGG